MIDTTLEQIADIVNGSFAGTQPAGEEVVTAVATDNRHIKGGELFVAIKGERVDGNRFAKAALEAGATGILTADRDAVLASGADPNLVIIVADPIIALGKIAQSQAHLLRSQGAQNFEVVGVTGSVGKTTTKDLLAEILGWRGPMIAPPGSFNNELGLPLTVLRADSATSTLVLEMGADHIGNLKYLTDIVQPDISVVLAVARAHLGEFGGIENVAQAKAELVTGTRENGIVILNHDDERVRAMAIHAPGKVVFFSASGAHQSGVWASDIEISASGHASFILHYGDEEGHVDLSLVGEHHVANALAAASVGLVMGMTVNQCAQLLSQARAGSPHRMDVWHWRGATIIDDSYNANPDSMRAGLRGLAHVGQGKRTIAVLGQMLELGAASHDEHRSIGQVLIELGIDVLIAVGPGLEPTVTAAKDGQVVVFDVPDVSKAHQLLDTLVSTDDVVLLKGSNGSGVWQLAEALKEKDR